MKKIIKNLSCFFWRKKNSLAGIKRVRRHTKCNIHISQKEIIFVDSLSFFYQYKEIFEKKIYNFIAESNSPLIIDCGSNIGLSILFFKEIYPKSRIFGFEPDPFVFSVLKENISKNGYNDVNLFNKAVWINEETLEFEPDGSDGGRISLNQKTKKTVPVSTVCLSNFLDEDIDLLKIDIEGAEIIVLQSCKEKLNNVKNIFIEYHSIAEKKQELHILLKILSEAGFRIHIHSMSKRQQPFIKNEMSFFFDMQLNIFAFRE